MWNPPVFLVAFLVARFSLSSYIDIPVPPEYYVDTVDPGDYNDESLIIAARPGFGSKSGILSWKEYQPLRDHYHYHRFLLKYYPQRVKVTKIGNSHEGRHLNVFKICFRRKCGYRPIIFIDAAIHAREWISPAAVSFLIKELVENQEKHEEVLRLFDWYILPFVNPDGYLKSWEDGFRYWRKNMNPRNKRFCKYHSTKDWDHYGVDLNRNFEYHWKRFKKRCDETYPGQKAFSEVETKALRVFLQKHKKRLMIVNSVHAAGEKIVIPWGHTQKKYYNEDNLKEVIQAGLDAMGEHGRKYIIGNVMQMFEMLAYGGSVSWVAKNLDPIFTFVTELVDKDKWQQTPDKSRIPVEVDGFLKFSIGLAKQASKMSLYEKKMKLIKRNNFRRRGRL